MQIKIQEHQSKNKFTFTPEEIRIKTYYCKFSNLEIEKLQRVALGIWGKIYGPNKEILFYGTLRGTLPENRCALYLRANTHKYTFKVTWDRDLNITGVHQLNNEENINETGN